MTRSRQLMYQAAVVVLMGGAGLIRAPATATASQLPSCFTSCSDAIALTTCPIFQYSWCRYNWYCPIDWWEGYCEGDS